MRENMGLYRGRLLKSDQWVKGNLLVWKNGNCSILVNDLESNTKLPMQVDPETVGQFTEFHDKNIKKIFEGDIVKDHTGKCFIVLMYGGCWVIWDKKAKGINWDYLNTYAIFMEIIGNIYDNPELLKEGENDE